MNQTIINRREFVRRSAAALGAVRLSAREAMAAESSAPGARLNFILLEGDDLNYAALGCMGDSHVKTPNLDRLAERGILFRNNICQGTMCSPSRNSLLTGSYPHNTGVYHNQDGNMAAGVWTFPAALQRAGYFTALVGKNHFKPHTDSDTAPGDEPGATAEAAKSLGFEHVHSIGGKVVSATKRAAAPGQNPYQDYLQEHGLLDKLIEFYTKESSQRGQRGNDWVAPNVLPEERYEDSYIASRAIEWLRGYRESKPYLLWVDFVAPHPPADAPEPYASMYDWETMPLPLDDPLTDVPPDMKARAEARKKRVAPDQTKKFRAGYYAMISLLDAQVGRIVQAVEERGEIDRTVFVFFGDQGSMLYDHWLFGKGVFYKGSINSPLIIAGPPEWRKGEKVAQPNELLDVAPTVLELAGASDADRAACRGTSLTPLLTGRGEYRRPFAFAEDATTKMAVDGRYKLVAYPDFTMLFDLQADPDELKNLATDRPDVVKDLKARIDEWLAATPPVREPNPKPRRGRPAGKAAGKSAAKNE
ncbi:MAG: sulfatase-like hydrolase/transferase [Candidatus Sumerlaeota bacterium]|nr:sulfatase-like hydrolase/transferase [Candidatus Sumerlaeota bacterium]